MPHLIISEFGTPNAERLTLGERANSDTCYEILVSVSSNHYPNTTPIHNTKPARKAPPKLKIPAEFESHASLIRLGQTVEGTLKLTTHHLVFKTHVPNNSGPAKEIWIGLPLISSVQQQIDTLRLCCKDFLFVSLKFAGYDECAKALQEIESRRCLTDISKLYAYFYTPATVEKEFNGWEVYQPEQEYERMGALTEWRFTTLNHEYKLCKTYPKILVVPTKVTDFVLEHAAKHRSKNRLPVLSYYLKVNKATISRCSQPLVGIKQNRSSQDEFLVSKIFESSLDQSNTDTVHGATQDNVLMDLRPSTNAIAQVALGGGTEHMERYKNARKVYSGIDNLHIIRESMNKVVACLKNSDINDKPPNPLNLEKTQWLKHIQLILDTAMEVVNLVYYKCSHVVVHCSDGWDRTPQVTSLAMLMLDPYYRTLEGFMVLVEKEWVSFGHQFQTRSNLVQPAKPKRQESDFMAHFSQFIADTTKGREDGPIFQQFLDCVYQLSLLFPTSFEFDERFLRRLVYHTYSCQYGTFLFNSELQRENADARSKTRSVWDYFLARRQQFTNTNYVASEDVITLPAQWKTKSKWWASVFGRSDAEFNDPKVWEKYLLNL